MPKENLTVNNTLAYDGSEDNISLAQLQNLAGKLNALDGQKGKYLTGSELKSQVFGMMTSFRQSVPVKEQLRQMKLLRDGSPQREQQLRQAELHLQAQIYTLNQGKEHE